MDRDEHVRSSGRIYDDGRIHLVEERAKWREKMSVLAGSMQNKSLDEDCIVLSNNI
jgi:hypothetical protein